MKRELIYVAGPYSSTVPEMVEVNVSIAIRIGLEILKKGHIPFIPHLNHLADIYAQEHGIPMSYNDFMAWDEPFRQMCDSLYYIDSSPGTDIEMIKSWNEGKRIYYSMDEIKPYVG
jgi:hypothetical protein